MAKILYFIKCILTPTLVRSFKKMSIFIALLIFVIEFWIILLPSKLYIDSNSDYTASYYQYTDGLYNIKDTNVGLFDNMKVNGYRISNGEITASNSDVSIYSYLYYYNEKNYGVYFIYDINDQLNNIIEQKEKEYYEIYPNDTLDSNVVNMIVQLAYVDSLDGLDLKAQFEAYRQEDADTLSDKLVNIPYHKFYNVNTLVSNKNYSYVFTKDSIIRTIEGEFDIFSYEYIDIDINNYSSLEDYSKALSVKMVEKYNETLFNIYLLYIVIYVLLFPILASIILSLFMKKHQHLESVLDYYKVASLVSIIPALIACLTSFIFGPGAKSVYIILFIVYSVFMIYKAATSPDNKDDLIVIKKEKKNE